MTTERTRTRRHAERAHEERSVLDAILDAGVVAHVAVVDDDQPFIIPMAYARDGDRLLLHGSTASRLMRLLAAGVPTCVSVTHLDGIVVARSAFESSMQYRSALILGRCRPADDHATALERITDGLLPGRWDEARPMRTREAAATSIVELPLEEWSVKVSTDGPGDPPEDRGTDVWAGVLPVRTIVEEPVPDHDVPATVVIPPSVTERVRRGLG
jgi:nitroimidazol reductase NimA-like FMN-containing flavoprotein (pyridoxamine 5'-phosphate oxidase superfamily)